MAPQLSPEFINPADVYKPQEPKPEPAPLLSHDELLKQLNRWYRRVELVDGYLRAWD